MRRHLPAIGLALACVIPLFGGLHCGVALVLEGGWDLGFVADHVDRLPLFVHVVTCAAYYVLGALQLLPGLRRRHPKWHRRAGAVALLAGLFAAATALWMSALHPGISGPILRYSRLVFAPLWLLFLGLGALSIARRDFAAHGAWMVRAFAVGMPAGTLVFLFTPFWIVMGEVPPTLAESIQSFAFVLHLGVAELLIRRARSAPRASAAAPALPVGCLLRP